VSQVTITLEESRRGERAIFIENRIRSIANEKLPRELTQREGPARALVAVLESAGDHNEPQIIYVLVARRGEDVECSCFGESF